MTQRAMKEMEDLTEEDIAGSLGVSVSQLRNRLRVLQLPDSVLDLVSDGTMGWTAARELLCLVNHA